MYELSPISGICIEFSRCANKLIGQLFHSVAEEWQKFAFPVSEVLLHDCIHEKLFGFWQCLCRMVELVFGEGRSGWTEELSRVFHNLAHRHNILLEEALGRQECRITLHNLCHVKEGVRRFSSPYNYWCYVFERAVSEYVNTPNNCRNLEYTLSEKKARREFLKFNISHQESHSSLTELCESKVCISFLLFLWYTGL